MNKLWLALAWLVSLVCAYGVGWVEGLRNAAKVAISSTHFMTSVIEYLFIALLIVVVSAVAYFHFKPKKTSPALPLQS